MASSKDEGWVEALDDLAFSESPVGISSGTAGLENEATGDGSGVAAPTRA